MLPAADDIAVELGDVVILVDAVKANLWCYLWTTAILRLLSSVALA